MVAENTDEIINRICDVLENDRETTFKFIFSETERDAQQTLKKVLANIQSPIVGEEWDSFLSNIHVEEIVDRLAERDLKGMSTHDKEEFINIVKRITEPNQSLFWLIYGYSIKRCLSRSTRKTLTILNPKEYSSKAISYAIEEVNKGYNGSYLTTRYFKRYRKVMNPVECRGKSKIDQKKYLHKVEKKATKIIKQYKSMNKSGNYFSDEKHTVVGEVYTNYLFQVAAKRYV